MAFPEIPDFSVGDTASGGGYRAYNQDDSTKVAYNPNTPIDFNARERYVDLSGVSAFCHPQA